MWAVARLYLQYNISEAKNQALSCEISSCTDFELLQNRADSKHIGKMVVNGIIYWRKRTK